MGRTFDKDQYWGLLLAEDCSEQGWHISFRLAPGVRAKGDPRVMLGELANMGACRVIGHDEASPARADLDPREGPVSWDMVLVGDTTRAAIERVFVDMPDAMELVIEPIHPFSGL